MPFYSIYVYSNIGNFFCPTIGPPIVGQLVLLISNVVVLVSKCQLEWLIYLHYFILFFNDTTILPDIFILLKGLSEGVLESSQLLYSFNNFIDLIVLNALVKFRGTIIKQCNSESSIFTLSGVSDGRYVFLNCMTYQCQKTKCFQFVCARPLNFFS